MMGGMWAYESLTFGGYWAWDPVANAYYWHRFFSHQADLNFDKQVNNRDKDSFWYPNNGKGTNVPQ